jgi:hypothetical protein
MESSVASTSGSRRPPGSSPSTPETSTSPAERPSDADGFAIWPEDTREAALTASEDADSTLWRGDPESTAKRFASEVLGWREVTATVLKEDVATAKVAVVPRVGKPLDVSLRAELPQWWSVLNVIPHGEYFPTMTVRGGRATLGVELEGDADSAEVTVGYGGREKAVTIQKEGTARIDLGSVPETTGHFLVLYRDRSGEIVSALGTNLPAGRFVAG